MHSTRFTAMAQVADAFGRVVVTMHELPTEDGLLPGAIVILSQDDTNTTFGPKVFSTHRAIETDIGGEPTWFFDSSAYDLDYGEAVEIFLRMVASECNAFERRTAVA